jgi:hypothetical protein
MQYDPDYVGGKEVPAERFLLRVLTAHQRSQMWNESALA